MIETENRKYHFIAMIVLKKGVNLSYDNPSEDVVKWFHLQLNESHLISFIYKIIEPKKAKYDTEFAIQASLLDEDNLSDMSSGIRYNVLRGQEKIGSLEITKFL